MGFELTDFDTPAHHEGPLAGHDFRNQVRKDLSFSHSCGMLLAATSHCPVPTSKVTMLYVQSSCATPEMKLFIKEPPLLLRWIMCPLQKGPTPRNIDHRKAQPQVLQTELAALSLASKRFRMASTRLSHRAQDGAAVDEVPAQTAPQQVPIPLLAGNDVC